MARSPETSRLRQMVEDRERGISETRDEFDRSREDDASVSHENAHLRTEDLIDRSTPDRRPSNQSRDGFAPELARNGQLVERFDVAREDDASQTHELARSSDERTDESQMVRESQPRPEPTPPKAIERAVKRESFAKRWADEMARHNIDIDKPNVQDRENSIERDRDVERSRERDR